MSRSTLTDTSMLFVAACRGDERSLLDPDSGEAADWGRRCREECERCCFMVLAAEPGLADRREEGGRVEVDADAASNAPNAGVGGPSAGAGCQETAE